jgi:hypothetical protein
MTHDVFISYSSMDKPIADGICATMEQNGVRCWIAPRDIRPGADWGESIIHAIADSRVFVLVLSHSANTSSQIKREVERAVNHGLPIIPYRIENVVPERSLEYFVSTTHWLDAFTPPVERHAQYLADTVKRILNETPGEAGGAETPRPAAIPPPPPRPRTAWLAALLKPVPLAALLAGVLLAAGLGFYALRPPSFVGAWSSTKIIWAPGAAAGFRPFTLGELLGSAMTGPNTRTTFSVTDAHAYKGQLTGDDQGTVERMGSDLVFTSRRGPSERVRVTLTPIGDPQVAATGGKANEAGLVLRGYGDKHPEPWVGLPDASAAGTPLAGVAGVWRYDTWPSLPTGQVWSAAMKISANGAYRITLFEAEGGLWSAADGKWKKTLDTYQFSSAGAVTTGSYQFAGRDVVTITTNSHSTTWKRDQ